MVRPRKCKKIYEKPNITYFKPRAVPLIDLEEVVITVVEFEAIRLKDFEGNSQERVAKKMNISQPTLHRLLLSARKKIADALVNGKAMDIHGGNYILKNKKKR